METVNIQITRIKANTGQIKGVPANPRQWTREALDRLKESITKRPELLKYRGLVVYPHGKDYIVLGGNMRLTACKELGYDALPCFILPKDTPAKELKDIILADNSDFGKWDARRLRADWSDIDFEELGIELLGADDEDFSDKNKDIDPDAFSTDITLRLRLDPMQASFLRVALGDNPKDTLLKSLGYES